MTVSGEAARIRLLVQLKDYGSITLPDNLILREYLFADRRITEWAETVGLDLIFVAMDEDFRGPSITFTPNHNFVLNHVTNVGFQIKGSSNEDLLPALHPAQT